MMNFNLILNVIAKMHLHFSLISHNSILKNAQLNAELSSEI
jgi:hypothetical protein